MAADQKNTISSMKKTKQKNYYSKNEAEFSGSRHIAHLKW